MQAKSEEDRQALDYMLQPQIAQWIRDTYERCRARGEAAMQEVREEGYRLATRLAKAESDLKESQERLAEALMKLEEVQNHGRGTADGAGGSQAGPMALGKDPADAPPVAAAAAPQENAPRVKQENGGNPSKRARV